MKRVNSMQSLLASTSKAKNHRQEAVPNPIAIALATTAQKPFLMPK